MERYNTAFCSSDIHLSALRCCVSPQRGTWVWGTAPVLKYSLSRASSPWWPKYTQCSGIPRDVQSLCDLGVSFSQMVLRGLKLLEAGLYLGFLRSWCCYALNQNANGVAFWLSGLQAFWWHVISKTLSKGVSTLVVLSKCQSVLKLQLCYLVCMSHL